MNLLLLSWILGCARHGPKVSPPADSGSDTAADSGGQPCTPVRAVFFDLGETLVTARSDGLFETIPEAATLLAALGERDLSLGVITNVPRGYDLQDLRDLLVDPTLLDGFDVVLLSSEAESPPKPDPAIYAEAVNLLSDPPPIAQTAFVTEELADLSDGDPPTEGAQAAGMIGVHVSDEPPSPLADLTVASEELPSIATAAWLACLEAARP